jgi:hypothetical protein
MNKGSKKSKMTKIVYEAVKFFDNFNIDLYLKILKQRKEIENDIEQESKKREADNGFGW